MTGYLIATGHKSDWYRPGAPVIGTLVITDERGVAHELVAAAEVRHTAWALLDRLVEAHAENGVVVEVRAVAT